MGRVIAISVLVAAVVGGIVLSSYAGTSLTPASSEQQQAVAAATPATCARPARQSASALLPLQGTPTPTSTGTVVIPTPTVTRTATGTVVVPTPTVTRTATGTVVVPTPTVTRTATGTVVVPTPTVTRTATGTVVVATPTPTVITAVQVVSFSGKRASKTRVLLRWKTAAQVHLLGFNVYCGSTVRVRRNAHLLAARPGAYRYSFLDRVARNVRRPGPYWLQLVDLDGNKTWFGSTVVH